MTLDELREHQQAGTIFFHVAVDDESQEIIVIRGIIGRVTMHPSLLAITLSHGSPSEEEHLIIDIPWEDTGRMKDFLVPEDAIIGRFTIALNHLLTVAKEGGWYTVKRS